MIPNAVFVAARALQNKFPLFSNFQKILGACQRSTDIFCWPRESMESILLGYSWRVLWVLWEYGVDWYLLLAVK